ncbi:hypothetical protein Q0601_01860 [Paracoccus onubensis]|uniref:hypothetical protein n=1 Tax=Paracoccus onubensis TaxID=1675788 RepID=UPI0027315B02|nr:hypothetical protein [Paracoccus onubensis]MDP0925906.1 hypothetical protein [Paracoccus onubensis]
MKRYSELVSKLGYSTARNISNEKVASLFESYEVPPGWYGFPPALVPIISDGSLPSYIGLWKHWFVQREVSFVTMSVSDDYRISEIARNEDQLSQIFVANLIVLQDEVTEDATWLAKHLGVENIDEIDGVTMASGDDPEGFSALSSFKRNAPLSSCDPADYDGEFPTPGRIGSKYQCYFEYAEDSLDDLPDVPEWVNPNTDKPRLFDKFLNESRLDYAWLTLNGTGWHYAEAAAALDRLRKSVPADENFQMMADIWISFASEYDGGY